MTRAEAKRSLLFVAGGDKFRARVAWFCVERPDGTSLEHDDEISEDDLQAAIIGLYFV